MVTTLKQRVLGMEPEGVPHKNTRWKVFRFPPSMVLNQIQQVKLKYRLVRISAVQTAEVYDTWMLVCACKAASWKVNDLLVERIREEVAKDAY